MLRTPSLLLCPFLCAFTLLSAQPAQFENRGIGGGGALFSPAISPHDPDRLFMACDMTELFHSENGGETWSFFSSNELTAFQNSRVQFTGDPNGLYVLALQFREGYTFPVRSADGGQSWEPFDDPTEGEALYLFTDPNAGNRLLISTWDRMYYTGNGGVSWDPVYDDPNGNLHLAGVFWNGYNIYVGTNYGLLVSNDSGQSFALDADPGLPPNIGFSTLTGARSGNTVTLFGIGSQQADLYPTVQAWEYGGYQGIYRRQFGAGATDWEDVSSDIPNNVGLFQVAMAGQDPDVAYAAGTNANTSYPVVYKTTNSGSDWNPVFLTLNNYNIATGWSGYQGDEDWYYGEYALGLAVSGSDPDQVVLTDLGFVHRSTDGGQTWQQQYVAEADAHPSGMATPKKALYRGNGLENTSCWWIHWTGPERLFSAFTDIGGMSSPDGGQRWTFDRVDRSLNSTYQFVESPDGILYAATSSVHDLYQSTYLTDGSIDGGSGRILYSADEGQSWATLHDFGHPVVSMALDPNDPKVMYAGVVHSSQGGIYKTTDLQNGPAATWEKLPDPPRTEGHPLSIAVLEDGSVACSFSGRRASNFTNSSGVFYSTDGGDSWEDRSHPDMHFWTKDLVVDPNDPQQETWYAAVFSGWGGAANDKGGLYRTTDRGQSWQNILDLFRVESISIRPGDPGVAYVTTEDEGLWYTSDLDVPQPTFAPLEAYRFLHPLRVFFNPYTPEEVWITSFGNGMSVGGVAVGTNETDQRAENLHLFPNPVAGSVWVELPVEGRGEFLLEVYHSSGELLHRAIDRSGTVELDLSRFSPGLYLLVARSENHLYRSKLIVQR